MKRNGMCLLAVYLLLMFTGCATASESVTAECLSIIPQPQQMTVTEGRFVISDKTKVSYNDATLAETTQLLAGYVGIDDTKVSGDGDKNAGFVLQINATANKALGQEGYTLSIKRERVLIEGNTAAGVFFGVQTIRQLMPASIEAGNETAAERSLPCVEISDVPRYRWRGFMLDESRHFFGREQVKKTLDIMAFYKLNRFHWHLTDETGWRLEIKQYPKLTTLGGRGNWSDRQAEAAFYTQGQIREIVDYARKRHIVIVPEIDMPGHATAANLAYPAFSGGGTSKHPEFTFNPGLEATYEYLENILKETAGLFPGPWIHFGGDEVHFANKSWNDMADVQALMKKQNLKDLHEVEMYFNRRMAKVIDRLGRTTVGWDEVVGAGLDPDKTVVMWWRHNKPGQLKEATEKGFDVVLCPRIPCYFDFVQHKTHKMGRAWGGFSSLRGVYEFPEEPAKYHAAESERIIGIQANLWTERVHNLKRFDYMVYPRMSALAEAAWTCHENKSYDSYQERLKGHMDRYDVWGITPFNVFDPAATPEPVWPEKK